MNTPQWESFSIFERGNNDYVRIDRTDRPLVKSIITPCECAWVEPYGFVPEADCPEHDNAEFVAQMNAQFGAASASATAVVAVEDV